LLRLVAKLDAGYDVVPVRDGDQEAELVRERHAIRATALAVGVAGVLLFVWSIRIAGTAAVLAGVTRVGAWFVVIWLLGGVRYLARAIAWRMCVDDPRQLPVASAFVASLAGDALGNVTPFGAFVSEPSKIVFVRRHVGVAPAISALTIENLLYSAALVVMLVGGTAALLLSFDVSPGIRRAAYAILCAAVGFTLFAVVVLMRRVRVVSVLLGWLARWPLVHDVIAARRAAVRAIEDDVFGFVARHPARVAPIVAIEAAYHGVAVLEIWLTVTLITREPVPLVTAFVLEFVNRTITIAFQFVPMWLGVDEAGTGLITTALHLGAAVGVGLALIRKARVMLWTALGLGLVFASSSWSSMRWRAREFPDPMPPAPAPRGDRSAVEPP
jgi:hypothetical protein